MRSQRLFELHLRHDRAVRGGAPVGLRQEAGDEVGDVHRGERQEDALHPAVGAARDQQPHADGDRRARPARRDVGEAEGGGDARELGHVVPKLATSRASMAKAVTLRLNFSRMSAASPLPVTAPMRAPISWVTARMGVISSSSQSML